MHVMTRHLLIAGIRNEDARHGQATCGEMNGETAADCTVPSRSPTNGCTGETLGNRDVHPAVLLAAQRGGVGDREGLDAVVDSR